MKFLKPFLLAVVVGGLAYAFWPAKKSVRAGAASSEARAIAAPPKARINRAPATKAATSSRVNISGGTSKPARKR